MLDTLLDIASAPRRFLWSIVPGLHDPETGDAY
jgi:hypothetical protein